MRNDVIGRPMDILLVEDSLMHARLTIKTLKKSGLRHRLIWSRDGMDAREFLFQEKKYARAPQPDLILLDLNLPSMHGKELLAKVRSSDRLRNVPAVIMTGEPTAHGADDFAELDVQGYLEKPLNKEQFLITVHELKSYWKADMILPIANQQSLTNGL